MLKCKWCAFLCYYKETMEKHLYDQHIDKLNSITDHYSEVSGCDDDTISIPDPVVIDTDFSGGGGDFGGGGASSAY